ncbi:MAG: hypothetical protein HQM00_15040, partial [Magnetococcales bacterium]|nr:hypothetical protein [Magnetococcales bacterium]
GQTPWLQVVEWDQPREQRAFDGKPAFSRQLTMTGREAMLQRASQLQRAAERWMGRKWA